MSFVSGGDIVAKALKSQGVRNLFTLCGGHIQAIYEGCLKEDIRVVDFRHEQSAAHAADGWARATGRPGVAAVTAGPGVTDSVTAVANAYRAQVPMILIGGQAARTYGPLGGQDRGGLQEMNHIELMKPITKWAVSVPETRRLAEYVHNAFRVAQSGVPGPVFLEMPVDILFNAVKESEVVEYSGDRTPMRSYGDPEAIRRAADLLNKAERPLLIVGSQWRWSGKRHGLAEFLETAPLPTFVNGMARGALPPGHPQLFRRSRNAALQKTDLVLVVGTPLDFRLGYGEKIRSDAAMIQIDLDGGEIGRNRAVDVGIVADAGVALSQLAAELQGFEISKKWLAEVREFEENALEKTKPGEASDREPIDPLRLAAELNRFVDEKTILVGDGGDFVATASYVLDVPKPESWMDPGPLGTLGVGPGYAMAAKLAHPDHKVVLVLGDGTFGLNGMEFEAMARQNIPVVGVIGNDASWRQIHRSQVAMYGEERAVATNLNFTRYDKVVEALGGHGEYVERLEDLRPALERAFASGLPALVNVKIGVSDFRKDSISL